MKFGLYLFFVVATNNIVAQKNPLIKDLEKQNGKVSVESVFQVDTTVFSIEKIWLDSNYQVTKESALKGVYFVNQTDASLNKPIDRLRKSRPVSCQIDSILIQPKEFTLEKSKVQIVKGKLTYKLVGGIVDYIILDGYVQRCEYWTKKRTRLKSKTDYSGLHSVDSKSWLVSFAYDKKGNVKRTVTYVFKMDYCPVIIWRY